VRFHSTRSYSLRRRAGKKSLVLLPFAEENRDVPKNWRFEVFRPLVTAGGVRVGTLIRWRGGRTRLILLRRRREETS
jgi:hypothetical protein